MNDPKLVLSGAGVETREYLYGSGDGQVRIPVFVDPKDAARYGTPIDLLIFVLLNKIEELEARLADAERIVVAGPGWVPVGGMPAMNECAAAGRRIFDRVAEADATAITQVIDPASVV